MRPFTEPPQDRLGVLLELLKKQMDARVTPTESQERLQKERKQMRDDMTFFQELLQTPGLSQQTKDKIDETICRLVIIYNNPVMIVKGDEYT